MTTYAVVGTPVTRDDGPEKGVCVWNCEILKLTGGRASHKVRVISIHRACQEVPPCQCLI